MALKKRKVPSMVDTPYQRKGTTPRPRAPKRPPAYQSQLADQLRLIDLPLSLILLDQIKTEGQGWQVFQVRGEMMMKIRIGVTKLIEDGGRR